MEKTKKYLLLKCTSITATERELAAELMYTAMLLWKFKKKFLKKDYSIGSMTDILSGAKKGTTYGQAADNLLNEMERVQKYEKLDLELVKRIESISVNVKNSTIAEVKLLTDKYYPNTIDSRTKELNNVMEIVLVGSDVNGKPKFNNATLQIKLPAEMKAQLEEAAAKETMTVSLLVRKVMKEYLDKQS